MNVIKTIYIMSRIQSNDKNDIKCAYYWNRHRMVETSCL